MAFGPACLAISLDSLRNIFIQLTTRYIYIYTNTCGCIVKLFPWLILSVSPSLFLFIWLYGYYCILAGG